MSSHNKEIALQFFDLTFNQKKPREAAELYLGEPYVQHNPHARDGRAAFVEHFIGFFNECPGFEVSVKRVFAEDDFVILHVHAKHGPADREDAIVEIFRMKDGKIVEHWDVIQEITGTPRNENGVF